MPVSNTGRASHTMGISMAGFALVVNSIISLSAIGYMIVRLGGYELLVAGDMVWGILSFVLWLLFVVGFWALAGMVIGLPLGFIVAGLSMLFVGDEEDRLLIGGTTAIALSLVGGCILASL